MSKITRGKIVTFLIEKGKKQQIAIAYDSEQAAEFSKVKKVFIRYVNEKFHPMKDDQGKNIVGLKDAEKLTIIGFVDYIFIHSPKQKIMKRAPKRRSFWEYNRDNGYWVVWAITIFFSIASFSQSTGISLAFLGIGVVTVVVGLIDWRRLG